MQARREKGNKGIGQQIIMKIKQFEFKFITLKGDYTQIITINLNLKALNWTLHNDYEESCVAIQNQSSTMQTNPSTAT